MLTKLNLLVSRGGHSVYSLMAVTLTLEIESESQALPHWGQAGPAWVAWAAVCLRSRRSLAARSEAAVKLSRPLANIDLHKFVWGKTEHKLKNWIVCCWYAVSTTCHRCGGRRWRGRWNFTSSCRTVRRRRRGLWRGSAWQSHRMSARILSCAWCSSNDTR